VFDLALILGYLSDPMVFLPLLFVYSVLVAIILPFPVEVALVPLLTQPAFWAIAAVTIGGGKAVGSFFVYHIGKRADKVIDKASSKAAAGKRFRNLVVRFVAKTRYVGLFLLLSVPLMTDTLPLYVYSFFNDQGELLHAPAFVLTNFLAGVSRALLLLIILVALGVNLLL
jgi:membrane protein YqaA with SNARE-associated domain